MHSPRSFRISGTVALACALGLATTLAACSDESQQAGGGGGGRTASSGSSSAGGAGGKGGVSGGTGGSSSASAGTTVASTGGSSGAGSGGGSRTGGRTGQDTGTGGAAGAGGTTRPDAGIPDVSGSPDAEARVDTGLGREAGDPRDMGFPKETGAGPETGTGGDGGTAGGFCPASEPCRISPLGDSITEGMGWNYPGGGGYRSKLFSLILKDSKKVTFVGTRSNGPETVDGVKFPKNHEGTSGITIQDLQKNVVDRGALTGASVKPHIILLHIGTNNLRGGSASQNATLLGSLIDSIIKNCPDALLVVAKIIPMNGSEAGYNAEIPAVVDARVKKGAHIIIVDQTVGFDPQKDIGDGVHPNEGGYIKMAAVWYKAISEYLK